MARHTLHRSGLALPRLRARTRIRQRFEIWGADNRRIGKLHLWLLEGNDRGEIIIEFDIKSDGTCWTRGSCTIYWAVMPAERYRSKFYCEVAADGVLEAVTLAMARKRRALKRGVLAALEELGEGTSPAGIGRRLEGMGFPPDASGLEDYIDLVFHIGSNFTPHSEAGGWRFSLWGVRRTMERDRLEIDIPDLPRPIHRFLLEHLGELVWDEGDGEGVA